MQVQTLVCYLEVIPGPYGARGHQWAGATGMCQTYRSVLVGSVMAGIPPPFQLQASPAPGLRGRPTFFPQVGLSAPPPSCPLLQPCRGGQAGPARAKRTSTPQANSFLETTL